MHLTGYREINSTVGQRKKMVKKHLCLQSFLHQPKKMFHLVYLETKGCMEVVKVMEKDHQFVSKQFWQTNQVVRRRKQFSAKSIYSSGGDLLNFQEQLEAKSNSKNLRISFLIFTGYVFLFYQIRTFSQVWSRLKSSLKWLEWEDHGS